MRAVHYGLVYTAVLSAAAPGFLLQALGWGPRTLAPAACAAAWAAISVALFAALSWRLWRSGTGRAPRRAPRTSRCSAFGVCVWGLFIDDGVCSAPRCLPRSAGACGAAAPAARPGTLLHSLHVERLGPLN